jgi:hypothetical protein
MGLMRARRLVLVVLIALCASGVSALWGGSALAAGAPTVGEEWAEEVGITSAKLAAKVNPNESDTTYHFEYGTNAAYGTNVPVSGADIGAGAAGVTVGQIFGGLQAGTTYHYRLVATSAEGTTEGPDHTFRTFAAEAPGIDTCPNALIRGAQFSSYLPDCRAYEMVSPVHKGDADVAADPTLTQSSADGDAIKYDSLTAFGDAQGSETRGGEYVAQRGGGEGWFTHAINPLQNGIPLSLLRPQEYENISEDLSKGVYVALAPVVAGHPNVEKVTNLYLRTDLLSSPPGNYELLNEASTPLPPAQVLSGDYDVAFAGASADYSHVLFESTYDLTPQASVLDPSLPKVYEWVNGAVRLEGILPNGEAAADSIAGQGAGGGSLETNFKDRHWKTTQTISADGSRVLFTGPPLVDVSEYSGADMWAGNLYLRTNGSETVQINASERSEPDPGGPQPARFWTATPDDSKVLFTTRQLLTDEAVGSNLYEYDVNAPAGKHLRLISVDDVPAEEAGENSNRGIAAVGISEDGSYIYFLSNNRLTPDAPRSFSRGSGGSSESRQLYVWHDGTVRFVATHNEPTYPLDWFERVSWGQGYTINGDTFRMTPDGKTVMFESEDPETKQRAGYADTSPQGREMFVYDYGTNRVMCASCNPTGAASVSDASFASKSSQYGPDTTIDHLNRPLSDDGRYAFFDTGDALVPQDTNGKRDVYEFDTATEQVHLISSGVCDCHSYFVDASASGHDVFFTTHQRLVRVDFDDNSDLYDARIEGGIASQNEAPPEPCEGDDCQGPAKPAHVFSVPASATFNGVGNTPPPVEVKKKTTPRKKVKPKNGKHKRRDRHRGRKSKYGKRASRRVGR